MNPRTLTLIVLLLLGFNASGADSVAELDWISGHWCSKGDDERIEEFWLPPHGAMMIGMSRTLVGKETRNFEYVRIVMDQQGLAFVAQPGGRPPVVFQSTGSGNNWIRFENLDHDFPQRIEYRREGHLLHAKIAGPGSDGQEFEIPFSYAPC